jgi:uncharacterized protein (DUF4415 family)
MKNKRIIKNSATDWARIDAMRDEDIDLSDSPELTPEMFAKAVVRRGVQHRPKKVQLTLRLEEDVLAWFRARGRGYQTQINDLLRAYMEAHEQESSSQPKANRRRTSIAAEVG